MIWRPWCLHFGVLADSETILGHWGAQERTLECAHQPLTLTCFCDFAPIAMLIEGRDKAMPSVELSLSEIHKKHISMHIVVLVRLSRVLRTLGDLGVLQVSDISWYKGVHARKINLGFRRVPCRSCDCCSS